MDPKCMRCGTCCRCHWCLVPKYSESDLSEENLEKLEIEHGFNYVHNYIRENSEEQGDKCKWLKQNSHIVYDGGRNDIAICNAYNRRCSMCKNHNNGQWCNLGIMTWKRHKDAGNEIPKDIMEIILNHPMYKSIFKED